MDLLPFYVQAWREAADDVQRVGADLTDTNWEQATDCPGWRARDVLAHLVDIEELLTVDDEPDPTRDVPLSEWTEVGVDQRREVAPAQLLTALDAAVRRRYAYLTDNPPTDPKGAPPRVPADRQWDWDTLLRNRAIDMWVHSQDIRRAVGRPGGFDNAGAQVTITTFGLGMPYVLGKKVRPPAGTTVVWDIDGTHPAHHAVEMSESGRAVPLPEPPAEPSARLGMETETFVVLAAGRRDPKDLDVSVSGDADLAARVLRGMVLTF
ncbi:MAG TPA: maleylpyruvate isomerase family mycothiol-dependent enzyme [Nocardioidaceae bacterium]|nr:maleylpyruvate isomerase family mycothiol-dependent enzyme [Nocardioidaceae bacterium]